MVFIIVFVLFRFTCTKGFLQMMKEIHDIAGQHEVIAENLGGTIVQDIHSLATELKQERKKVGFLSVTDRLNFIFHL